MWLLLRWFVVLHTYFACVINVCFAVAIPQFISSLPTKGNSFSVLPFTETNRRQSAFYYEKNCVNGVCVESNSPNNGGGFENGGLGNGNFGVNRVNFGNGGYGNGGNLGNPNNNFGVNGLTNEHQSAFYYEKNCVNGVCTESNSQNRPNGGSNNGGLINTNFVNQQRPPFNNFNIPGEFNQQSSYYVERTCVNGHCTDKVYNNGVEQGSKPSVGSVGGNNPTNYPMRPPPTFPNNQSPTFPQNPSVFFPEMVDPVFNNEKPVTTSTTTMRAIQAAPNAEECKESLTKVNGVQIKCSKTLLFDSSFSYGLNRNWSHVVQMAEDDESEFTVFDRDIDNIHPQQGSLVIKPIFLDKKKYKGFVTNDTLDLTGRCTSPLEKECKKEAVGRIFLPPILSARITTERSFSFRYGRVEIKAKLPRGDWVVPEMWLLPKSLDFGRANSGKIVLAKALGNDDFKIDGADSGNKFFYSKLRVGDKDTTFKHKKPYGSFSDGYHLFQMLWTPDRISFGYDNELTGEWSTISHPAFLAGESEKIAPFNQEFYLVLGVHVGGTHDFPDGSTNRGKRKPWKNNEVARRKSFYDDSPNWLRTWDDNTALRIEYVRVWSL